jgi:DNA helicase-2/ATP-dependent DNA helicase PcrA
VSRRVDSPDTPADIALREVLGQEISGCFIVNAGAGSGKTTSLVKALAHLKTDYGAQLRQRGQQVACITYTEVAAGEIHGEIDQDPLFHVSTIHSFLWKVIKPFKRDIAAWVLRRIDEKIAALEEHNAKPRTQAKTIAKNLAHAGLLKADRAAVPEVTSFTYGVGSRYGKGILGHDDIIKMVPQLILDKPLLRKLVARNYPFIFVDESQDTFPKVVEALKSLSADPSTDICIGFFGDPMQQIYSTGVGEITRGPDWTQIDKPENFRCPTSVLSVINNIRSEVPGTFLQQGGRRIVDGHSEKFVRGEAHLFVLPIDEARDRHLSLVREWLAMHTSDPDWVEDHRESDVKILVIEHRLAARRLGFEGLFSCFHDQSTDALKTGVAEGTAWPTLPFVDYITPLAQAVWDDKKFVQVQLIRTYSPLMNEIKQRANPSKTLESLSKAAATLAELMKSESATVRDVLSHALESGLISLGDRFRPYEALIRQNPASTDLGELEGDMLAEGSVLARFLKTPAPELHRYQGYLKEHSVYATHQGVKGAEFKRVMVLIEDDAAMGNTFSYDKLLGLRELSDRDRKNIEAGLESTIDRTRRLLYVACSRAESALAVVLFAADYEVAVAHLKQLNIFEPGSVHDAVELQGFASAR